MAGIDSWQDEGSQTVRETSVGGSEEEKPKPSSRPPIELAVYSSVI